MLYILQTILSNFESRYVWIDQYCIQQDNPLEKEHQVKRMKDIYRQAYETIIWLGNLGDHPEYAHLAFEFLRRLHDQFRSLREKALVKRAMSAILARHELCTLQEATALAALLRRPWFTRVWVIQEAILSSNAVVQCASSRVPWKVFCNHLRVFIEVGVLDKLFLIYRDPVLTKINLKMKLLTFLRLHGHFNPSGENQQPNAPHKSMPMLKEVLRLTQNMNATDQRDKIYAVLGLCSDMEQIHIQYASTYMAQNLYYDVAMYFLQNTHACAYCQKLSCPMNELSVLGEACVRNQEESRDREVGGEEREVLEALPSWIPIWRPCTINSMWFRAHCSGYGAGGDQAPVIYLDPNSPRQLQLWGLFADEISICSRTAPNPEAEGFGQHVSPNWIFLYGLILFTQWIGELWHLVERHMPDVRFPYRTDDFCCTLCCNTMSGANLSSEPTPLKDLPAFKRAFEDFMKIHDFFAANIAQPMLIINSQANHLRYLQEGTATFVQNCSVCRGRKFFLTKNFRMGIGPGTMRQTDVVCVFAGAPVPVVLRPTQIRGQYLLVGDCYVHGLMNGEIWKKEPYNMEQITLV